MNRRRTACNPAEQDHTDGRAEGLDDDTALGEYGYRPTLVRTLGSFHTFAAGLSCMSVLTGIFQLFYLGIGTAGPAYWWSWPVVFIGQLLVALCFCELAARYPVAGSIYNWAKQLTSPHLAWLAGWAMVSATVVALAAVSLALQATLPELWSGFQFVPSSVGGPDTAEALNGVVLALCLIAFTTFVNAYSTTLMAWINSIGVVIEIVAALALIVLLAINVVRGPEVLLSSTPPHDSAGSPFGTAGAFLVASLASAYILTGFDTSSSLAEESHRPRRDGPRAMLRSVIASFVLGGLILLFALMAAPNLSDPRLASLGGLQILVLSVLGGWAGAVILVAVAVATIVCALTVHASAIRLGFAMGRDNNLPASSALCTVNRQRGTPVVAAVAVGCAAAALLLLTLSPQVFTVVTSINVIMIYLAYLSVTLPMLTRRIRGTWTPNSGFTIGRTGVAVNLVAVLWGVLMTINLAYPRPAIYNATGPTHWYLLYGGILYPGVILGVGFTYYWFVLRRRTTIVEAHRGPRTSPVQERDRRS